MNTRWPVSVGTALATLYAVGIAAPCRGGGESAIAGAPTAVKLGPVLRLKGGAVMAGDGHVEMLLVTSEKQGKLTHYEYSTARIESDDVGEAKSFADITTGDDLPFLAVFDPSGNLHVVLADQHYTRTAAGWSAPEKGPPCRLIAAAADSLVCMLVVSGQDVGSPRRWDWGIGPGFVFPWHLKTQKIVLTRRTSTGWSDPIVVDRDSKFDAGMAVIGAEASGAAHLIYIPMTSFMGTPAAESPRYVRLTNVVASATSTTGAKPDTGGSEGPREPESVGGQDLPVAGTHLSLALDPQSGRLFSTCWGSFATGEKAKGVTIDAGAVSGPIPLPGDAKHPFETAYVAAAGRGRFHVIASVTTKVGWNQISHISYLTYSAGTWSSPVAIGDASSYGGERVFGLQLVADGAGHAFVTWIDSADSMLKGRSIALTD